jgi:hypothetical protein
MPIKNSIEIVGNRTRDLPACSAVPQPTAPPRNSINLFKAYWLRDAATGLTFKNFTFFHILFMCFVFT